VNEQDIQAGLERGLVDPEVLKSFFELDQHPIIAELTRRFQVAPATTDISHHLHSILEHDSIRSRDFRQCYHRENRGHESCIGRFPYCPSDQHKGLPLVALIIWKLSTMMSSHS